MAPDRKTPIQAALIDADNMSASYVQPILEEIIRLGEANVRRIYVENLVEAVTEKSAGSTALAAAGKQSPWKQMKLIAKAIEDEDDDGWTNRGGMGSRILAAAPVFDARTYGCPILSMPVDKSGGFEVCKDQGAVRIRPKVAGRKTATVAKGKGT